MKKIILTTFTDPMMGLSYECEPIFRKLETHYGDQIEFRYVMAGLVRDISDFMMSDELALKPEEGVRKYCQRLAQIYKEEESISGMPVNMDGFHLFDADHRSSYPLNIAYEAARLTAPEKADFYLYRLRYATIVETRQTTLPEELSDIASETGIDKNTFLRHMYSGSAEAAFQQDMQFARSLNIYSLPAYLLQYGEKAILIRQLIGYDQFVRAISGISNSMVDLLLFRRPRRFTFHGMVQSKTKAVLKAENHITITSL